jgi:hypothetical protein
MPWPRSRQPPHLRVHGVQREQQPSKHRLRLDLPAALQLQQATRAWERPAGLPRPPARPLHATRSRVLPAGRRAAASARSPLSQAAARRPCRRPRSSCLLRIASGAAAAARFGAAAACCAPCGGLRL